MSIGNCFVAMPFSEEFRKAYDEAIKPAVEATKLRCVRIDEDRTPGPIPEHIVKAIREAVVCVFDISGNNPNVFLELGQAQVFERPTILISRTSELPFDVRSLRVFFYEPTNPGYRRLRDCLTDSLSSVLGTDERVLEELLAPATLDQSGSPFVIAASPLPYREAMRTGGGYEFLRRTSSDHVGIRGLIQAFGAMYGLKRLPELLNPNDYDDRVVRDKMHLYCIASPKANRWTSLLLQDFYDHWEPRLEFKADPLSKDLRNVRVRIEHDDNIYIFPGFNQKADRREWDFGVMIRGPHPRNQDHLLMILAGRSALGTEAACHVATIPKYARIIRDKLKDQGADLNDHKQAFWVTTHVGLDKAGGKYEADLTTLTIASVERFRPRQR